MYKTVYFTSSNTFVNKNNIVIQHISDTSYNKMAEHKTEGYLGLKYDVQYSSFL